MWGNILGYEDHPSSLLFLYIVVFIRSCPGIYYYCDYIFYKQDITKLKKIIQEYSFKASNVELKYIYTL